MAKTSDKPAAPDFNFDKALRDEANLEPFRIVLDGKVREFAHLESLDSVAFSHVGKGADSDWKLVKLAADEETYADLRAAKPSIGQLKQLMKKYVEHCGLGDDAAGE